MSEALFERSIKIAAPPELAARFFADADAWFRLNPEWEVLAYGNGELKVRYERSEVEAAYRVASLDFSAAGGTVALDGGAAPRRIELSWRAAAGGGIEFGYREPFAAPLETERRAELSLWFDAAAGYLALAARSDRRARFGRWLLDRCWLRMSPMARRVGLLVIGMEGLALLLFIAVLIVYRLLP